MNTQIIFIILIVTILICLYSIKYTICEDDIEKFNNTPITSDKLPLYGPIVNLGEYGVEPWGKTANFKNPKAQWIWHTRNIDTCHNNTANPGKIIYNYNNTTKLTNITLHILVQSSVTVKLNDVIVIDKIGGGWKNTDYPKIPVTLRDGINMFEFYVVNADKITDDVPETAGLIVSGYDDNKLLFSSSDGPWLCDYSNEYINSIRNMKIFPIYKLGNFDMGPWNITNFPDPTAKWIWYVENANTSAPSNDSPIIFQYYFQNKTNSIIRATIHAHTDDRCQIMLNDKIISEPTTWQTKQTINIELTQCYHIFKFSCWNGGGPGGFLASVIDSNNNVLFNTNDTRASWFKQHGWFAVMKYSEIPNFISKYPDCIAYQVNPDSLNIKPFTLNGSDYKLAIHLSPDGVKNPLICTEKTQIPLTSNQISNYTLFHVCMYNNLGNKGRIINGVGNNWLSGFWNGNQDCSYQENWNTANNSGSDNSWRLSCDWFGNFRSNGKSINTSYKKGISYLPPIGINLPNATYANETSSFNIECVFIFQTQLSFTDILNFETLLANRYNIPIPSMQDRCRQMLDTYINTIGGLYARYLPENMRYVGLVNTNFNIDPSFYRDEFLLDASPNKRDAVCYTNGNFYVKNINSKVPNGNGSNTSFPVLGATTSSSITLTKESLTSYTLFHVMRYTNINLTTKKVCKPRKFNIGFDCSNVSTMQQAQRIINGSTGNWLSGFWNGQCGVAYHEKWVTPEYTVTNTNWYISCDRPSNYIARMLDK